MRKGQKLFIFFMAMCLFWAPQPLHASWQDQIRNLVNRGAVLAVDEQGNVLYSLNAESPFVPASTLKVATALAALDLLGPDFRFKTDFFQDDQGHLYIKGYGDPFLISEELTRIAQELKAKGLKKVTGIILETSYFGDNVQVPGLAGSLNPYDAYNGALLANFNTINIIKNRDGSIESAESQTPLTDITRTLAERAPYGKSRINVAVHRKEAPLYVGYLLKEFLTQQGIQVTGTIREGSIPANAKLILSHVSSKDLAEVLRAGLKYSQNLIMNQIFLVMGVKSHGPPADLTKAKGVFQKYLKENAGLKNFNVEEGSGISRKNFLTALEMDKILVKFFPHYALLPRKHGMWVKTGTLHGVATLVGYFRSPTRGWVRFTILLNQGANHRDRIAKLLKDNL